MLIKIGLSTYLSNIEFKSFEMFVVLQSLAIGLEEQIAQRHEHVGLLLLRLVVLHRRPLVPGDVAPVLIAIAMSTA